MRCETVRLEVDALTPDALPPAVLEHLEGCADCRAEADWSDSIRDALRATRLAEPQVDAAGIADRVLGAGARQRKRRRGASRRRTSPWPTVLALAAALLLGLGILLQLGKDAESQPQASAPPPPEDGSTETETETDTDTDPQPETEPVTESGTEPVTESGTDPEAETERTSEPVTEPERTETGPDAASKRGAVVVAVVQGKADVRSPGSDDWRPLRRDERLGAGDSVRTRQGTVALLLAAGPLGDAPAALAGTWIRLAPKAEVSLPARGATLGVERGEVFVDAAEPIELAAGDYLLAAMGCEMLIAVNRGNLAMAVFSQRASVRGEGRSLDLRAGQRCTGRGGKLGRVRKGGVRPRWLRAHRAPGEVLFEEPFDAWRDDYMASTGLLEDGVAKAQREDGRSTVRFGVSEDRGGLFRTREGLRVRVRYRLSRAAPLTLQLMNHTQVDNFHTVLQTPRAGRWTEVLFHVGRFADNAKQGKRWQDGDLLGYVSIKVQGDVTLEVDDVVAYVPFGM